MEWFDMFKHLATFAFFFFIHITAQAAPLKGDIVVFGHSQIDKRAFKPTAAKQLGRWIAKHNYRLYTVAADQGNFGALIEGASQEKGAIKVMKLLPGENADQGIINSLKKHNHLPTTVDGRQVKYQKIKLTDSFVADNKTTAVILFPGGIGAVSAFFDVLNQNLFNKNKATPVIVYNKDHYWDGLVNQLESMDSKKARISARDLRLFVASDTQDLERILKDV